MPNKYAPIKTTILDDYSGLLHKIEKSLGVTGTRMAELIGTTKQAYSQMAQKGNSTIKTVAKLEESLNFRILIVNPKLDVLLDENKITKEEKKAPRRVRTKPCVESEWE